MFCCNFRYIMLCGYPPFYGQCGIDCGWERGEMCQNCQEMLFTSIQDGFYEFPEAEWSTVSEEAKDLIRHLLVREPSKRFTAAEVLKDVWVTNPPEATPLATPRILTRYVSKFNILVVELSLIISEKYLLACIDYFMCGTLGLENLLINVLSAVLICFEVNSIIYIYKLLCM